MEEKTTGGTLGTFAGVFTPSLLTILGIILFLRLGFVIGNAGLASALLIHCPWPAGPHCTHCLHVFFDFLWSSQLRYLF